MGGLLFRQPVNTWTHGLGMLLAIPMTVVLWRSAAGDRAKQWSLLVFGVCAFLCYGGSALYHGIKAPEPVLDRVATLDYIGIYLLIAGTVTPPAVVILRGNWRRFILGLAWGMAVLGIILRLLPVEVPDGLSNGLYLGMGWAMLASYFELSRLLSHRVMRWAVVGGVLYSIGAVLNWLRWPHLWPGTFSSHEVMHLFVMAGTTCHFLMMLFVVVPYVRREPPEKVEGAAPELPTRRAPQQMKA